jgi:hypothetical protein
MDDVGRVRSPAQCALVDRVLQALTHRERADRLVLVGNVRAVVPPPTEAEVSLAGFRRPPERQAQGVTVPGIDKVGDYGPAIFGGGYAGHHGGKVVFAKGADEHPLTKGLDDLTKFDLTDRSYRHKIVADDVTVLIEMKDSKEPQTWCRINKDTKQRTVYTVRDPRDIEPQESVRVMLARALFWAAEKNEADYKK